MYTSDNKLWRHMMGALLAGLWFAFFGAVYERFSHEVYSFFMIYAFGVPLCLGALPYGLLALKGRRLPGTFLNLWNSALLTLTVGCVFKGVLDIYGTTNRLLIVYPTAAAVLAAAAAVSLIFSRRKEPPKMILSMLPKRKRL